MVADIREVSMFEQPIAVLSDGGIVSDPLPDPRILVRETNHRVANALQLTSALVRMEAGTIADHAARSVLMSAQLRIEAVATVHRMLCQSGAADSVSLDVYLESLIDELRLWCATDRRDYRIDSDIAAVVASPERASTIGIIVTELVANARKHAFHDTARGRIAVRLEVRGTQLILQVSDDGVGRHPREARKGSGLGRRLIDALVAQLRGTVHEAAVARGTTTLVRFPRVEALGG